MKVKKNFARKREVNLGGVVKAFLPQATVRPDGEPYLYGAWMLKRWKAERRSRVILCNKPSDVQMCWSHGIPALGIPDGTPFKKPWINLLISFPELVILERKWPNPKFVNSIKSALKVAEFGGQVKVVCLPPKDSQNSEAEYGNEFEEVLDDAISKASAIDLDSLPPDLEQQLFHPALHNETGFSSVGIILGEKPPYSFNILTSLGGPFTQEQVKGSFIVTPLCYAALANRWRPVVCPPRLNETIALFAKKIEEIISFKDRRLYYAIAAWTAGTYLSPLYPAYPYLNIIGEKESGKAKLLDCLQCSVFNPLRVKDVTPDVIKSIDALRPTLLIDEIDRMESREAEQIVNNGYKRGATLPYRGDETDALSFYDLFFY